MSSDNPTTRTRILDATRDLLDSQPGDGGAHVRYCEAGGVSRQALYLHFPNRTELFIATTSTRTRPTASTRRWRPGCAAAVAMTG